MSEIKDSGARRTFESGAERDISDDKGRCDLLPLETVSSVLNDDAVLRILDCFMSSRNPDCIIDAIKEFCSYERISTVTAMLEVAKHYSDGAKKYAERNWEKGIPLHCYIDSGVRHYLKHRRGDTDEPHDRAFIWNMLGLHWTLMNKPEMNDLPDIGE